MLPGPPELHSQDPRGRQRESNHESCLPTFTHASWHVHTPHKWTNVKIRKCQMRVKWERVVLEIFLGQNPEIWMVRMGQSQEESLLRGEAASVCSLTWILGRCEQMSAHPRQGTAGYYLWWRILVANLTAAEINYNTSCAEGHSCGRFPWLDYLKGWRACRCLGFLFVCLWDFF